MSQRDVTEVWLEVLELGCTHHLLTHEVVPDCEFCARSFAVIERDRAETRAAVLAEVERHLAAVQYDPAPYTAMKARLAALKSPT